MTPLAVCRDRILWSTGKLRLVSGCTTPRGRSYRCARACSCSLSASSLRRGCNQTSRLRVRDALLLGPMDIEFVRCVRFRHEVSVQLQQLGNQDAKSRNKLLFRLRFSYQTRNIVACRNPNTGFIVPFSEDIKDANGRPPLLYGGAKKQASRPSGINHGQTLIPFKSRQCRSSGRGQSAPPGQRGAGKRHTPACCRWRRRCGGISS